MSFFSSNSYSFQEFKKHRFAKLIIGKTPNQKILRIYGLIILIGAILLSLPISRQSQQSQEGISAFFNSLFTAISAFTNTGLTTYTTSSTFNFLGQLIILLLIQTGGLGFLTILIFLWSWLRRGGSVSVEQRWFLHLERGSNRKSESLPVVKTGITFLLVAELIGALLLTFFFYFAHPLEAQSSSASSDVVKYRGDFWKSLWSGVFHSVSAANNAGFDILGKHSIIPYRNEENNMLSVILLVESIIGGIGYPVFYDIYMWQKHKNDNKHFEFSLFSKIAMSSYLFIACTSAFLALIFEISIAHKYPTSIFFSNSASASAGTGPSFAWGSNPIKNKIWNVIYLTFSSRSSGFSSIDTSELTEATKWLLSSLMFIGTSPASTGGGVRTVTIFIIFARMFYTALGKKHLSVYNRTIDQSAIMESCIIFVLSSVLIVASSFFIMVALDRSYSPKSGDVIFEAASAFGTTGLTSGVTSKSNFFGKIVLMILMFIGQLGVSNTLVSLTNLQPKAKNIMYCSEPLRIT